ncbi:MAG: sulfopyruvate decarboxylase subunit alpha [Candidatus Omnitrophota bacterium]|nr:sulfopyruvate decarboxylase subunit alpha [Candidatus Omnitrophota bacterium]
MRVEELKGELKKSGFDFFTGVPCSILGGIIKALGEDYIPSVREDTAIGLACGAYLGGKKPCVLMQNSGLGYSLNVLTSLNLIYGIPVLLLVSYRGFEGKDAPEHLIMGKHCVELVRTFEIPSKVCEKDDLKGALVEANRYVEKGKPYCIFIKEGTLE